jgi:hypothetical protein
MISQAFCCCLALLLLLLPAPSLTAAAVRPCLWMRLLLSAAPHCTYLQALAGAPWGSGTVGRWAQHDAGHKIAAGRQ